MFKFVRFLAQSADTLLLLVSFVLVFRLVFLLSPAFDSMRVCQFVDRAFGPFSDVARAASAKAGLPLRVRSVDFSLLPVLLGTVLLRHLLNRRLSRLIRTFVDRTVAHAPVRKAAAEENERERIRRKTAERRLAIQAYTEAKEILEASQQDLTFVALDVVGSTKMKIGEDPIVIERTFNDYRALVETLLERCESYKCTWTPDGQMAAFKTPDLGVRFGKAVLDALPAFNAKSRLKTPFKVRVGANSGLVSTDDATPMEKLSSFVIDLTGHLQKYAEPDTMWVSERTHAAMTDKEGFVPGLTRVDDTGVFVWKRP